jgi:hypothetical protein
MTTPMPPSPFLDPDRRFVLNENRFIAAIMFDAPAFLRNPRQEYLRACEIEPILEALARCA